MTVLRIAPLFAFIPPIVACRMPSGAGWTPSSYSSTDWRGAYDSPYRYSRPYPDHYQKKKSDADGGWGKPVRKVQKTLKKIFH